MATGAAAKLRGDQFEKEVEALLRSLGYWRVRRNVILKDVHGNTSQIDLVCGLWKRIYVECKCYQDPVPLKDVAKFSAVLELNSIPSSRGLFVTNSTYVPRATTIGIKTVDGYQLQKMWRKAKWRTWTRASLVVASISAAAVLAFQNQHIISIIL